MGTPGDDGKPLPNVPARMRKAVKGMVAINYPLLRVGTREVRARPLLALPKGSPHVLFVSGPQDPHMDISKLDAIRKKMKVRTELVALSTGFSETPGTLTDVVQRIAHFIK